jgi:hypothetical protein
MTSDSFDHPGATGKTLRDAEFDRGVIPYYRLLISLVLAVTIIGIPLISFWLIFTIWYAPEYHRQGCAMAICAGAARGQDWPMDACCVIQPVIQKLPESIDGRQNSAA